jgi:5-methylcytosine-specific restriction endonuclease McrA
MPIIRSGYAVKKRNGSTRAYRKARAELLSEETLCAICGQPPTPDNPLEADHITPHAYGGTHHRTNLRAAHRTCNNQRGALPA